MRVQWTYLTMAARFTPFLPLSLPIPFLQPAWFLMVGGDRSFKLTEKDEEFSDELRKDCEVKGLGRWREGRSEK